MAGTNNLNITSLTVNQASKETTINDIKGLIDSAITDQDSTTWAGAETTKVLTSAQTRENVFFKATGTTSATPALHFPDSVIRGIVVVWNDLGKDLIVKSVSGAMSTTMADDEIRAFMLNGTEAYPIGAASGGGTTTVRCATTANITIASDLNVGDVIDGVTLAAGEKVLVKNQSSAAENGVYTAGPSPARSSDVLTAGMVISVAEGTNWADTIFTLTTNAPITAGATSLTFTQFLPSSPTWAASVRVATTANGTLATAFENGDTIDGVVLATSDRILLKDQSTTADNGIYIVQASGAPVRATDFDNGGSEVKQNVAVAVREGTANANKSFILTTANPITVGTTGLVFAQFGSANFGVTVTEQTGTSYTVVLGDANTWIRANNAAAITHTIPLNSTTAFVIGTQITWDQKGAGQLTLVGAGGVTIRCSEGLKTRLQYSVITITKIGTDEWSLTGDVELV